MVTTRDELLTPKEAARMLGMARCSIYRWIKNGWLPGIALPNGTIRIPKAIVERMLAGDKY